MTVAFPDDTLNDIGKHSNGEICNACKNQILAWYYYSEHYSSNIFYTAENAEDAEISSF